MKYGEFLNIYQNYRKQTAPDIREKLLCAIGRSEPPVKKHTERSWRYRMIAVGAAVMLIFVATGTFFMRAINLPVDSSSHTDTSDSSPVSVVGQIPNWYSPGKLEISSLTYGGSPLDDAVGFNGYSGMYFLDLTGRYNNPGHEGCSGVYYNTRTQKTVCYTHIIREALIRDGRGTQRIKIGVHFFEPQLGKILFTITSEKGRPSFCYDINKSAYTPLRVSLYQSVYHAGGYEERLSGSPYYVTMVPRGDGVKDDVLLINLETGEVTNILKNNNGAYIRDSMDDARLSLGGGYVLYTKMSGDSEISNSNRRTSVIYDIKKKQSREFQGEVIHMLPDDSRLVIRNPHGVFVYTVATGDTQPLSEAPDLPAQYRYLIGTTGHYTEDCYKMTVTDLLTNEKKAVSDKYIYTYAISRDYKYLYYYVRGEKTLACREMASGNEFRVPVDTKFIEGTEQEKMKDNLVFYSIYLDEKNNTLFLSYQRTERPRQDPEQARIELENDPKYQISQFFSNNEIGSISDMASLLEKYPDGLSVYEGKDFLFIEYSALFNDTQRIHAAYEDYRTNQFYRISHEGKDFESSFRITEDVHSFAEDEHKAVQSLIQRLKLPVQAAPIDYSQFIVDGKIDETLVANRASTARRIMDLASVYFVRKRNYTESIWGLEGASEMESLRMFLEFTERQNYQHIAGENQPAFWKKHEYHMSINNGSGSIVDLDIGIKDGKPFILFQNRVATISNADYQRWSKWMALQSEKCKHPPEM